MTLQKLCCGLVLGSAVVWSFIATSEAAATLPAPAAETLRVIRSWTPPPEADNFASMRVALRQEPGPPPAPQLAAGDETQAFDVSAHQPVWYEIELAADPALQPLVLELTHPSVRSAELYLLQADGTPQLFQGGRKVPLRLRSSTRFPATFELPAAAQSRTAYLRLESAVPMRGEFLLQPQQQWKNHSLWQFALMSGCFAIAAFGVVYALVRAWRLRSSAYGLYALLGLSTIITSMFISGYGESWLWPQVAPWRSHISPTLACVSAGLALLLAERAFAIEIRAPLFSRLLRWIGLMAPLAGLAGNVLDVALHQRLAHVVMAVAIVMALYSFWFAWRTANNVAVWLLSGFAPVALAAALTTMAVSGLMAFAPWVLMAMPISSAIEVGFNLYGLHLLARRHALVRQSLAEVARITGPAGEPQAAMLQRLAQPVGGAAQAPAAFTLMRLRFEGLAPGAPILRTLDAVRVEQYLQSMMWSAVRPGNRVGRLAFHEIVVRSAHRERHAADSNFLNALFAQALRCERYGLEPRQIGLRIAYGQAGSPGLTISEALDILGSALDDPGRAWRHGLEVDLWPSLAARRDAGEGRARSGLPVVDDGY